MKALGMDLGTKTLGLAVSDKLGIIASPYKTIYYEDMDVLIEQLLNIISEEKIDTLVLGLPKNMNNSLGFAVDRTLDFKKKLESVTNIQINLVDERLSTVEAENMLISSDIKRKKRKEVIDSVAASIILDTFLRMKGK